MAAFQVVRASVMRPQSLILSPQLVISPMGSVPLRWMHGPLPLLRLQVQAVEMGGSRRDMQKIFSRTHHRRARHVKGLEQNQRNMEDELNREASSLLSTEGSRAEASSGPTGNGKGRGANKEPVRLDQQPGPQQLGPAAGDASAPIPLSPLLETKTTNDSRPTNGRGNGSRPTNGQAAPTKATEEEAVLLDQRSGPGPAAGDASAPVPLSPLLEAGGGRAEFASDQEGKGRQPGPAAGDSTAPIPSSPLLEAEGDRAEASPDPAGKGRATGKGQQPGPAAGDSTAPVPLSPLLETKSTNGTRPTSGQAAPTKAVKATAGPRQPARDPMGSKPQPVASRRGQDGLQEAADASQDIVETVRSTVEEVGRNFGEASSEIGSAVEDVGEKAVSGWREVLDTLGEDRREVARDLEDAVLDIGAAAANAGQQVVSDSVDAVEGLANEGRVALEDGKEGDLKTSTSDKEPAVKVSTSPEVDTSKHAAGKVKPQLEQPLDKSPYKDLVVFVAGANGRLGRAVVEVLVGRGARVRALVRDASKARYLKQLRGVTVVEGDVYKFETLKKALGESDAIIVTTGVVPSLFDPLASYKVDFEGTQNLLALAKNSDDVDKFVLVTSLGVSLLLFPINLLGGILFWKKLAEQAVERSGLDYTIVRPGGLVSSLSPGKNIVLKRADTQFGGAITRAQVAEICVTALLAPGASSKIAEAVTKEGAPKRSIEDLFDAL